MRRSVPVITATAGALALLAGFHTTPASTGLTARSAANPTAARIPTTPTPSNGPASTPTRPSTAAAGGPPSPSSHPTTSPATAGTTQTVDGPVVTNDYGDVQVRITLRGSQIIDVQALKLPSDRSRSVQISRYAAPRLRAEALQAQSAHIDAVSGASYTSDSYAQSLQGALDHA